MVFFLISSGFTLNFTHCVALMMFAMKAAVFYLFKLLVYLCLIFIRLKFVHSLLSFIFIVNWKTVYHSSVMNSIAIYSDSTRESMIRQKKMFASDFCSDRTFFHSNVLLNCFNNWEKFLYGFQSCLKKKLYETLTVY